MREPMRIAIDAREMSKPEPGGFRSYLIGLMSGLAEIDSTNEYIIYVDRPIDRKSYRLPCGAAVSVVNANRLASDLFLLRLAIVEAKPHVVHFPCNYGLAGLNVPTVVTLHDCIQLCQPGEQRPLRVRMAHAYHARMVAASVRYADAVITVSDYSREEILRRFDIDERLWIVHQGVAVPPEEDRASPIRVPGCPKVPYLLVLASAEPRKNTGVVIDAFRASAAAAEGCALVAVCPRPSATEAVEARLAKPGPDSQVAILTDVSDYELRALYRDALAFVFASLSEGFGLPPLEAMAQGCPVISSSSPPMPEVLGDAAVYFDPLDPADLARRMDLLWHSPAVRASLCRKQEDRVRLFSWAKTAEQTLALYKRTAETSVHSRTAGSRRR